MAKRISAGTNRRHFGSVNSFDVGESANCPGEIQICQYGAQLVGPLAPSLARALAEKLIAAAETIENAENVRATLAAITATTTKRS